MGRSTIALLVCILISISLPKVALCDHALPQVEWKWSQNDTYIFEPAFSKDIKEITFVRKKPWRLEYEKKRKIDPRIADPEVVVVHIGDRSVERVGQGWAPCFSPDRKQIAYLYQKKPISGFRSTPKTLEGNEIVLYDRTKRESRTLARPKRGHLDHPIFSPEGSYVVYSLMYNIRGGPVGVGRISLKSKKQRTLLSPKKQYGFYCLIGPTIWAQDKLITVRERPATSSGEYLADYYHFELLDLSDGVKVIYSWKDRRFSWMEDPIYAATQDGNVIVFDDGWLEIDIETKDIIRRFGEKQFLGGDCSKWPKDQRFFSPNGKMIVYRDFDQLWIAETGQPKPKLTWNAEGMIHSITWSHDSNKIAVVVKHYKSGDSFEVDFGELVILRVN